MLTSKKIHYKDNTSYISLLDIIYPVGSVCLFWNDINPINIFGGTWIKIENALLSASGDSYGKANATNGNKNISINHMPRHNHGGSNHSHGISLNTGGAGGHNHYSTSDAHYVCTFNADTQSADVYSGNLTGSGYKVPRVPASTKVGSYERYTSSVSNHIHSISGSTATASSGNTQYSGDGEQYIPYHYNVNVWKRTA